MLLVIDMQPRFAAVESIIDNVAKEIERAKQRDEWIVFLKVGKGRVAYRLTSLTRRYYKRLMLTKYWDDGAPELFFALTRRSHRLNAKTIGRVQTIRVCGVNTGACVYSTVRSLALLNVRVEVLAHATAQNRDGYTYAYNKEVFHTAMRAMRRLSNVKVIERKG